LTKKYKKNRLIQNFVIYLRIYALSLALLLEFSTSLQSKHYPFFCLTLFLPLISGNLERIGCNLSIPIAITEGEWGDCQSEYTVGMFSLKWEGFPKRE